MGIWVCWISVEIRKPSKESEGRHMHHYHYDAVREPLCQDTQLLWKISESVVVLYSNVQCRECLDIIQS